MNSSPSTVADDMLTRQTRAQAIATAERIVDTRGGKGRCAAFWAEVGRALVDFVGDESVTLREDDVFSFGASAKAAMEKRN